MVTFHDTLGALVIGVVVAAILYGFAGIQTWYYYTHYLSDPWYLKLFVAAVVVSETCNQAIVTHATYTYFIIDHGVIEDLQNPVWSLQVPIFFTAFTTLLVQCFLAMRIYRLSHQSWLAVGSIMAFIIAEFLTAMIFGIKVMRFVTFIEIAKTLKGLTVTVNALAAAGDVVITACLCYLLQVSRTGFRRSDRLINKLIVFSINTGLLTSLCALGSLVSFVVWPHTWIYIAFIVCMGRLYCNSLLATLNARKRLRDGSREDGMSLSLHGHDGSAQQKTNRTKIRASSKRMPNNISIKIDTTQEYILDECCSPKVDVKDPEDV